MTVCCVAKLFMSWFISSSYTSGRDSVLPYKFMACSG